MSTTVDSRVVEMRFDNKHFESNVSTTMSTLDKFKRALHLDGATKGLENVNSAAKKVNMSNLGAGVEAVQAKFSALQVMGVTALANITNSAVNAGKRIVSALTIDPVKTGFQEYETQINAVQTILANTESKGTTIDDVNAALEELNKYADMTIYNFTEMTRNIGTFTAAGIDLDTSVNAIQGIANLAAVSGSTSQQASTAMYQLSQALASGTVKLMDWNSVVNAGMGGQVFQDALKETSRLMAKTSDEYTYDIDALIEKHGSFRETLSQGWLTAEVLTETLKKFTSSGANEYVAEYTGLTTEAVEAELKAAEEAYGEADAIEHASKALAEKSGKNADEIADMLKFAKTATDAATKVKTFTQLWDVLKEAAQSGWSQSWKLIIGDFEEAKELLTPLSEFLTGLINAMSDARNRVLQIALDFSTPWTTMMDKINNNPALEKIKNVVKTVGDLSDKLEYYQDVVTRVWRGEFKNKDTGRYELLEQAGYNHKVVQDLVNKGSQYKLTVEDIEASYKKFGLTIETTTEETEEVANAFAELSEEQLKSAGLTEDEIALYKALEQESARLGVSVSDLAEEMSNANGRDMLIESFKNIGGAILDIGTAIKSAWINIFNPPSTEVIGIRLYGIIKSLKEFTESLRLVNDKTGELTDTGLKFQSIFKGIFAAIDIVLTVVGGPLKIIFKAATQLLGYFGLGVLDVAAFIGEAIVKFRDWIDGVLDFTKAFDVIIPPIKKAIDTFNNWIATLAKSEDLPRDIAIGIAKAFGSAFDAIKNFFKKIPEFFTNGFDAFSDSPIAGFVEKLRGGLKIVGEVISHLGSIIREKLYRFLSRSEFAGIAGESIAGWVQGFGDGASNVWNAAVEMAKNLLEKVKEVLGIHSPSTEFFEIGKNIIKGLINGIKEGALALWNIVSTLFNTAIKWISQIDFGAVLAVAISGGMLVAVYKISDLLKAVMAPLEGISDLLSGIGAKFKASAFAKKAKAILAIAIAIGILATAVYKLAQLDTGKLWGAIGAVAVLLVMVGLLGALVVGLDLLYSKLDMSGGFGLKQSLAIIAIAGALLLLAVAVQKLAAIDGTDLSNSLTIIAAMVLGLAAIATAMALLIKSEANFAKVGTMLLKMSLALLIMVAVVKLAGNLNGRELGNGLIVVGALTLFFAALVAASKIAGEHATKAGKMLMKMSIAMLIMVGVIKLASMLEGDEVKRGLAVITVVGLLFTALIAVSNLAGQNATKAGTMLLTMSIALAIVVSVIKQTARLDASEVKRGLAVIATLGVFFAGIIAVSKLAGDNAIKAGVMLLAMSVALMVVVGVIAIVSAMDVDGLKRGLAVVSLLELLFMGLIAATKNIPEKCVGALVILTVAIALMVGAIAALTLIEDQEKLNRAVGALAVLMVAFGIMTGATKSLKKIKLGSLFSLLGAVLVLSGIIAILSTIDADENLLISVAGVSALMYAMAGVFHVLSSLDMRHFSDKKMQELAIMFAGLGVILAELGLVLAMMSALGVSNALSNVMALSGLLYAMTGIFFILSGLDMRHFSDKKMLKLAIMFAGLGVILAELGLVLAMMSALNVSNTLTNATALSELIVVLSGVLAVLSIIKVNKGTYAAVGALAILGLVVLELAAILGIINELGIDNSFQTIAALSTLLIVLTGVLAACSGLGLVLSSGGFLPAAGMAIAIAGLAALGLVVWELGAILNAMKSYNLGEAMPMVETLSALLKTLTLVLAACTVIGLFGTAALGGVIAMAALGLVVWELGAILNVIHGYNMDQAMPTVNAISTLLNNLTGVLGALTVIGIFAPAAVAGVLALVFMITTFGTLMVAIGTLFTLIDGMEGVLDKGVIIINKIAFGLGSALGNLVNGFVGAVGNGLVILGTQLSVFAVALQPFIASMKTIDESVLKGIGILSAAIIALTVADLMNGIVTFLPWGGSLANLGTQLSMFMMNAIPFIVGAKMINEDMLSGVKALAETILILTAANVIDGLTSWLTGGSSLENFATQLPILGAGLAAFATSLGSFTDEQLATVNCAAKAVKTLASAASEIPNTGGLLASIVGENDLGVFAAQFPVLGSGLAQFLSNVGTFTDEQVATVECAAKAIKSLAAASAEIPNTGGLLGQIVGENDLGTFAAQFPVLGTGLAEFLTNVGTFTDEQVATVECAAKAIKTLAAASSEIPNTGGLLGQIVGENDLGTFAEQFPVLGTGLAGFLTNLGTFTDEQLATVGCAANAIKTLAAASAAIPNTGGWLADLIGDNDLGTFAEQLPAVGTGIKSFVSELGTFTSEQVATVNSGVAAINALSTLANADLSGARKNLAGFSNKLPGFAEDLTAFCTNMPSVASVSSAVNGIRIIISVIKDVANANSGALATFTSDLKKIGEDAVDKFVRAFTSNSIKTDLKSAAKDLGDQVIDGIEAKEDAIETAGENAAEEAVDGVETQEDDMKSAGKDLGSGLVKGIDAKQDAVYWAGYRLGKKAVQGEKDGQESNSPSKLTIQAGKWLGEGLVIGIGKMGNRVYSAGRTLGETATGALSSSIARISDMISTDIDTQPTIRPVLDLSDVRSGASSLNNMFDTNASIGVMANVRAISSGMSLMGQNGGNDDVVSAINKLRNDISGMSGNTYQINGVTYDDGSNINEAVAAIVRHAKIERRV